MAGNVPMRKCVGCNEMKEKKNLIRIIKNDEGILIDQTGRKNGRGAYLCPSSECFQKSIKNKGLERSFKMAVPEDVKKALLKEVESIENK
ncbi:MAG: YlxR family protein [Eubacterium sp.]|nr:YlxR family protein [Eubacterium sp.]